jgi:FkbM family methyltransferase
MSIAHSLKKRAWRLRRGPVEATRLGASWRLLPRDWLDNRLLAGAPFEEEQIRYCRALIARNGIDLFVDVGANIGFYTVLLGIDPGLPEIYAFEPVSRTAERLREHVQLNGLAERVKVHQLALGREAGTASIHLGPRANHLARLDLATANRSLSVFTASETVRVAPLDAVLSHRDRGALVKIDAEGAGLDVLSGAQQFLSANRCAVQIETEPETEGPVADALAALGYRPAGCIAAELYFLHPSLAPAAGAAP